MRRIHDGLGQGCWAILPLVGLGLLLLGLQIESWASAELLLWVAAAVRSDQAPAPAANMVGEGRGRMRAAS